MTSKCLIQWQNGYPAEMLIDEVWCIGGVVSAVHDAKGTLTVTFPDGWVETGIKFDDNELRWPLPTDAVHATTSAGAHKRTQARLERMGLNGFGPVARSRSSPQWTRDISVTVRIFDRLAGGSMTEPMCAWLSTNLHCTVGDGLFLDTMGNTDGTVAHAGSHKCGHVAARGRAAMHAAGDDWSTITLNRAVECACIGPVFNRSGGVFPPARRRGPVWA